MLHLRIYTSTKFITCCFCAYCAEKSPLRKSSTPLRKSPFYGSRDPPKGGPAYGREMRNNPMTAETSPTRHARDLAGAYTHRKNWKGSPCYHTSTRDATGEGSGTANRPSRRWPPLSGDARVSSAMPSLRLLRACSCQPTRNNLGWSQAKEGIFTYSLCKTCVRLADAQERAVQQRTVQL